MPKLSIKAIGNKAILKMNSIIKTFKNDNPEYFVQESKVVINKGQEMNEKDIECIDLTIELKRNNLIQRNIG